MKRVLILSSNDRNKLRAFSSLLLKNFIHDSNQSSQKKKIFIEESEFLQFYNFSHPLEMISNDPTITTP